MSNSISALVEPEEFVSWLKKSLHYKSTFRDVLSQRIVERETQLRGVQLADTEVQSVGDEFRLTHQLEKAADTIAWLEAEMITAEEWEAGIRDRLLTTKLKDVMFGAEVERVFIENRVNFDQVSLYQIVVPYGQLAQELFYQIEEREISFFEAAHLYDIDPKRRQSCGYEGKLYRWSLPPELAAIVFGASSGELLRPVQLNDNHHVILVDRLMDAELSDELRTEILDNLFEEWMQGELNYLINH
ncbi:MAG: peptidylprolyl isomerase [Leptolyngbya sp. Prado105]|jgi:parvulin-like peptidyl-prolyl isomerase|nr:peptidylprolyl isomerase [Leptolyngbya sp. Prado105]